MPLEMSPGREAACRAVFGTWGFFPNDARKNCPFVLTAFTGGSSERCPGFGATFGPIILFSLFWKRTNRAGAIAGMLSGGAMVFIWKLLLKPMGGVFGIYELLPAFLVSCIFIVVVSLCTAKPSAEMDEEFEKARTYTEA